VAASDQFETVTEVCDGREVFEEIDPRRDGMAAPLSCEDGESKNKTHFSSFVARSSLLGIAAEPERYPSSAVPSKRGSMQR